MDYQQTIKYMYEQLPMFQRIGAAAYKVDLKNAVALDSITGSPHRKFKTIHVAGTNGKGSVSHILASILQTAGYKVGLYTSPHLLDFRERIRVNGKPIEEKNVSGFIEKYRTKFENIKPSFFEITVAMAFDYFAKQNVDIAIIEVGMGGRLDSTNIIKPILSVITNISIDHTQFLGTTLQEIATEKAGIIKKNIPVVIGETDSKTRNIFMSKADKENSQLFLANHLFSATNLPSQDNNFQVLNIFKGGRLMLSGLKTDLLGDYQRKNIITAVQAIEVIKDKLKITTNHLISGLSKVKSLTSFAGRWQILKKNPLTVCDTGHNESGITELSRQIRSENFSNLHIVIGFVNDKSIENMLRQLPEKAMYYFCRPGIVRGLDEFELEQLASNHNLRGAIYGSVFLAYEAAQNNAEPDDMIFIGGSTFVVAEIL